MGYETIKPTKTWPLIINVLAHRIEFYEKYYFGPYKILSVLFIAISWDELSFFADMLRVCETMFHKISPHEGLCFNNLENSKMPTLLKGRL